MILRNATKGQCVKKIGLVLACLLLCAKAYAGEAQGQVADMLTSVTSTSTGTTYQFPRKSSLRTHFCRVAGTGAVTATVLIRGSNDGSNFVTTATLTLSGTTSASDGVVTEADWPYMNHQVSAITGTGAAVSCTTGF